MPAGADGWAYGASRERMQHPCCGVPLWRVRPGRTMSGPDRPPRRRGPASSRVWYAHRNLPLRNLRVRIAVAGKGGAFVSALIVGAGPAGLMAAEILAQAGQATIVADASRTPARKFLLAGRGGLNLTHSEPLDAFLSRYGAASEALAPAIRAFPPEALRAWSASLGEPTFVGTSGRVFPEKLQGDGAAAGVAEKARRARRPARAAPSLGRLRRGRRSAIRDARGRDGAARRRLRPSARGRLLAEAGGRRKLGGNPASRRDRGRAAQPRQCRLSRRLVAGLRGKIRGPAAEGDSLVARGPEHARRGRGRARRSGGRGDLRARPWPSRGHRGGRARRP